ncbi:immunity protein Imm33 domain-containing protein [Paenibacillus chitinolyticus]|uniref:immunity protein Imm33 domain-containing protein n=1 Tax=Paenibacillus chitinolyticus TaxID=79263 RepID=UPI0040648183
MDAQKAVCKKYKADFLAANNHLKLGIALNVKEGIVPIHGLRINPEGDTTGWYIWAGEEFSEDPDFFVPLHVEHIDEWNPEIKRYLGLAPGWRFIIANNYEDVWFDPNLLESRGEAND